MSNIQDLVKKYYSAKSIPDDRAESILFFGAKSRSNRPFAIALTVLALAAISVYLYTTIEKKNTQVRLVEELAAGHKLALNMDITTHSFDDLESNLDGLGFSILGPREFFEDQFVLEGGGYGSILGKLGAEIKLKGKQEGKSFSLYTTKLNDDLKGITHTSTGYKDTCVELWTDKELFYGLVWDNIDIPGEGDTSNCGKYWHTE